MCVDRVFSVEVRVKISLSLALISLLVGWEQFSTAGMIKMQARRRSARSNHFAGEMCWGLPLLPPSIASQLLRSARTAYVLPFFLSVSLSLAFSPCIFCLFYENLGHRCVCCSLSPPLLAKCVLSQPSFFASFFFLIPYSKMLFFFAIDLVSFFSAFSLARILQLGRYLFSPRNVLIPLSIVIHLF